MTHHHLDLRRLLGGDGPDIGCEACFDLLDRYVEMRHQGHDADRAIPGMDAHLRGCPACAEEHDSLAALLAADGGSPVA